MAETDVNVLIVFYSRYGASEQLALAAGVGAIQERSNIRLRRLADGADQPTIEADPRWKDTLERLHRDYVTPRPADPLWADVIILAAPGDSSGEMEAYIASLRSSGSMEGKMAAPLAPDRHEATLASMYTAAACAGSIVVPAPAHSGDAIAAARGHGQRVSKMARALKTNSSR